MDDSRLLLDYLATGSHSAFAQIVQRHVDLVYATAYRHVHDAQLAEDITQAVFLLLARKAHSLRHEAVLAAWLLRATRYASLDAIKLRKRRLRYESEAAQVIHTTAQESCVANDAAHGAARAELLGQLDEALSRLTEADRRVLVLRFYEKRSFPEIGQVLGTTDESARKRVTRSVEKLRAIFARRRPAIATAGAVAVITAALANCANTAPTGLALRVGATATRGAFSANIASAVAHRMLMTQLRTWAVAACAGVCTCILGGLLVHSLLVHHDPAPSPPVPIVDEHDRPG
jgi:RNA polymerase sigma factor (sigma-70 family)